MYTNIVPTLLQHFKQSTYAVITAHVWRERTSKRDVNYRTDPNLNAIYTSVLINTC